MQTEVIELKNLDAMACERWKKGREFRRVKKAEKQPLPNGYWTEFELNLVCGAMEFGRGEMIKELQHKLVEESS